MATKRSDLDSKLWANCDELRCGMDAGHRSRRPNLRCKNGAADRVGAAVGGLRFASNAIFAGQEFPVIPGEWR